MVGRRFFFKKDKAIFDKTITLEWIIEFHARNLTPSSSLVVPLSTTHCVKKAFEINILDVKSNYALLLKIVIWSKNNERIIHVHHFCCIYYDKTFCGLTPVRITLMSIIRMSNFCPRALSKRENILFV